ncbi:MAG: 30S ribosomal protein S18 [Candidatus Omnitrophica bacterium]|nr:30S ribosomal protein S18 [Candidatus Omnitrophota bacterium]
MKPRAKICQFCKEKVTEIDYKDIGRIRRFVSGRGKILSAKMTGTCHRHQRMLTQAIKRARFVALLPYIQP